jgi:hypothetical protein
MSLLLLLLFAAVPWMASRYARSHLPRYVWLVTGAALGLVISPLSLGLYATYFAGPFGFPTGMLGLVSSLFHGAPGFHAARWLGLTPANEVVTGGNSFYYIELLNGFLWATVYGAIGLVVDRMRLVRSRAAHEP